MHYRDWILLILWICFGVAQSVSVAAPNPVQFADVLSAPFQLNDQGYVYQSGRLIGQIDSIGYVRDRNGQILGQFDSIGYVRDRNGQILGRMDGNGYIRDRNDRILAQYNQDTGYLRDQTGQILTTNVQSPSLALWIVFFVWRVNDV